MAEPPAMPAAVVASWAIRPGCWGAADGERLLVAELWAPAWALLSSEAGRRGHAGSVASASTRHLDCTPKRRRQAGHSETLADSLFVL